MKTLMLINEISSYNEIISLIVVFFMVMLLFGLPILLTHIRGEGRQSSEESP